MTDAGAKTWTVTVQSENVAFAQELSVAQLTLDAAFTGMTIESVERISDSEVRISGYGTMVQPCVTGCGQITFAKECFAGANVSAADVSVKICEAYARVQASDISQNSYENGVLTLPVNINYADVYASETGESGFSFVESERAIVSVQESEKYNQFLVGISVDAFDNYYMDINNLNFYTQATTALNNARKCISATYMEYWYLSRFALAYGMKNGSESEKRICQNLDNQLKNQLNKLIPVLDEIDTSTIRCRVTGKYYDTKIDTLTCTSSWFSNEYSLYNIIDKNMSHSEDCVQSAYNSNEMQPLNALAQYARQGAPVFNAGDAAGQNCQDLKWLKSINEKIYANVTEPWKILVLQERIDNPLKGGYPRGVTPMAFFRIAK